MDSIESIDPQFRLDAEVAPVYKCTNYNSEERTFEVFKVMFQNESKNVGTYVWCSESLNYAAPDNNSFTADLVYAGENHRDCPMEVRKA